MNASDFASVAGALGILRTSSFRTAAFGSPASGVFPRSAMGAPIRGLSPDLQFEKTNPIRPSADPALSSPAGDRTQRSLPDGRTAGRRPAPDANRPAGR